MVQIDVREVSSKLSNDGTLNDFYATVLSYSMPTRRKLLLSPSPILFLAPQPAPRARLAAKVARLDTDSQFHHGNTSGKTERQAPPADEWA